MDEPVDLEPRRQTSGRWVVPLIVAAIAIMTASAVYIFSQQKHAFDYPTLCEGNLQAIRRALFAYQESQGTFPPPFVADAQGNALQSWRVLLLPYLKEKDADKLYALIQRDLGWNDLPNRRFQKGFMPFAYHCPSVERSKWSFEKTHYVAITGPGTVFPGSTGATIKPDDKRILLVEYIGDDIIWTEPRDLPIDPLTGETLADAKLGSPHGNGPLVLFADGTIERWPESTPLSKLKEAAVAPP